MNYLILPPHWSRYDFFNCLAPFSKCLLGFSPSRLFPDMDAVHTVDCFQLAKACLIAQWTVIRLKQHCKSFLFVLKWILSHRAIWPMQDSAEKHYLDRSSSSVRVHGRSPSLTSRPGAWCIQTQTLDWRSHLKGKAKESEKAAQREERKMITKEKDGEKERKTGRETRGPRSIHVITFPLNSCQGPSAAISLMKCSWCYEQSAWQITSRITAQKSRLLKALRLCDVSAITPTCQNSWVYYVCVYTARHLASVLETVATCASTEKCHCWVKVPFWPDPRPTASLSDSS